ncbi:unnamed protein product [Anisakis simplex]|uniref:Wiskott-Aldrich syndrome protein family member n=1 Tax=Anisakis simplex TaxID=6269 RepID=A0A0M3JYL9_ANISI|nr:unnamed protein product [Anisakis simplex]
MALVSSEHLIEIPPQRDCSSLSAKVYGVVELEVQVSELLDNLSVALSCLYDITSLNLAKHSAHFQRLQQCIAKITAKLETARNSVQTTFKDIALEDDFLLLSDASKTSQTKQSPEFSPSPSKQLNRLDSSTTSSKSLQARSSSGGSTPQSQPSNSAVSTTPSSSAACDRSPAGRSPPPTSRSYQMLALAQISSYCCSTDRLFYNQSQKDTSLYTDQLKQVSTKQRRQTTPHQNREYFRISRI